jgi:hypothetical protein
MYICFDISINYQLHLKIVHLAHGNSTAPLAASKALSSCDATRALSPLRHACIDNHTKSKSRTLVRIITDRGQTWPSTHCTALSSTSQARRGGDSDSSLASYPAITYTCHNFNLVTHCLLHLGGKWVHTPYTTGSLDKNERVRLALT